MRGFPTPDAASQMDFKNITASYEKLAAESYERNLNYARKFSTGLFIQALPQDGQGGFFAVMAKIRRTAIPVHQTLSRAAAREFIIQAQL